MIRSTHTLCAMYCGNRECSRKLRSQSTAVIILLSRQREYVNTSDIINICDLGHGAERVKCLAPHFILRWCIAPENSQVAVGILVILFGGHDINDIALSCVSAVEKILYRIILIITDKLSQAEI